jgi:acetylornithine deacetylase/succinyl-diaminopimelate desuccinylase-like protein
MKKTTGAVWLAVGLCLFPAVNLTAQDGGSYRALARELLAEAVSIDTSVEGPGTTPLAEAIVKRLREAGYPAEDVQIVGPAAANRNLIVRLRGSGNGRPQPLLLLAHMDVVPAHREDWSLEPFTLTEQDGWFYGRGSRDNKAGVATLVTNLIRWKRERFVPARDIVALLTSFEEQGGGGGITWVLEHHPELRESEVCLNTDSGKGLLENGRPAAMRLQAAEKVFQSFRLEVRSPGGHSSIPGPGNAIYQLASALMRLAAHEFPVRLTPVTRAFFEKTAALQGGPEAADMKAVAREPFDAAAAERLSATPLFNAMLRTTCVATQLTAGHAENALPQRATATVNCRILPGEDPDATRATLVQVLADPAVSVAAVQAAVLSDASPLTPALVGIIERLARERWNVPVVPVMEVGATDGLHLRNAGVPTYGISALFDPADENRAHGRDERVSVASFYGAVEFWDAMVRAFAGARP